jgi:hypothetical protein
MENTIQIYQNNSKTILCTVTGIASLAGYTAVLTAKQKITDTIPVFTSTGTTDGLNITFELAPSQTNLTPNSYHYDVVLSDGLHNYSIVQSIITILDSVKY